VIPLDGLAVSRSLRSRLHRSGWETTVDRAFPAVIAGCADRKGAGRRGSGGREGRSPVDQGGGTWITPPMRVAYQRLHDLGHAHSLEVWAGDQLVGGLYGVGVGGVFTGESMFHLVTDASKVALVDLAARLTEAGGCLIDVQMVTPHLASLGARDLPRAEFLELLARARDDPVRLTTDRLPVSRLS
jgi:leucyl/phenylalanyl-tRNA---protein transferase